MRPALLALAAMARDRAYRPMRYHLLATAARARGLLHRWPSRPPIPPGYSGVSTGLTDAEARVMFDRHGWEPWCFQRAYGGPARLFRVRLSREERDYEAAMCRDRPRNP